jgi:hypothetical protein
MKSKFFRFLSFAVVVAFLMPAMTNAQTGKTNFAGNWAFNQSKSDMGQPPQGGGQGGGMRMGGNFSVKQEANLLTVERTRTGQDGTTTTTTEKYTLDGKESVNTNPRGESKSTVTWSADGKTLTIVTSSTFTGQDGTARTMTSTAEWTLVDAKTLSVKTSRPGQNGETTTTTMVYDLK